MSSAVAGHSWHDLQCVLGLDTAGFGRSHICFSSLCFFVTGPAVKRNSSMSCASMVVKSQCPLMNLVSIECGVCWVTDAFSGANEIGLCNGVMVV